MNLTEHKITEYQNSVSMLPDYPSDEGYTAAELKAVFDSRSDKEIKEKHNALIDELAELLAGISDVLTIKVDKVEGKGLSSNDFTEDYRIMVLNADMAAADAGNEIYYHKEDKDNPHKVTAEQVGTYGSGEIDVFLAGKVDKVSGKGLSSNDFTDEWKSDINNAINEAILARGEIDDHAVNQENPHGVTAGQIGAYTKTEIDDMRTNDDMGMYAYIASVTYEKEEADSRFVSDDTYNSDMSNFDFRVSSLESQIGDIETALDSILAMENELIGGESI